MVDLGALLQCLAEGGRADRGDHELLDVDTGIGVGAPVEDVHHRDRKHVGIRAADVSEEGQLGRKRCGLCDRERDPEDRIRPEVRLVRRAIEIDHHLVDEPLIGRIHADDLRSDVVLDRCARLQDALAAVAGLAVAALRCLEGAGRCAGRDSGPSDGVVVEQDLDLDRGIATGVEDFAGDDRFDESHDPSLGVRSTCDATA